VLVSVLSIIDEALPYSVKIVVSYIDVTVVSELSVLLLSVWVLLLLDPGRGELSLLIDGVAP
jgi:hypothetical protein